MSEIQRYRCSTHDTTGTMVTYDDGLWVYYEDHEAAIAAKDSQIRDLTARLAALTVAAQGILADHHERLAGPRLHGYELAPNRKRVMGNLDAALTTTAAEVRDRVAKVLSDAWVQGAPVDNAKHTTDILAAVVGGGGA